MPCNLHSWGPWYSTTDNLGLCYPTLDGTIYYYKRECQIAGCSAVEYVEDLEPKGKQIIDESGQPLPRITEY